MAKINSDDGPVPLSAILPQVMDGLDAVSQSASDVQSSGPVELRGGAADCELEAELSRALANQMEAFREHDDSALDLANAALLEMVTRSH